MTITESHNTEELKAALEQLKSHISRIQHDLDSPLSVGSGNVALLKELAIALNVYADVEDPLEDMGAALDKLTEQVDRLMVIRSMLSNLSEKL